MELDNLKNSWKVLDENLNKKEIVSNEQIKNIIMEKIETTLDKVTKRKKRSLIASTGILLAFGIQMFSKGTLLQGALYLSVIIPLIIHSVLNYRELKQMNINQLSPSEFLLKLNSFKLKVQQKLILIIPILVFFVYIFSMNGFFNKYQWYGFATGLAISIPLVLWKQYRVYKELRANLQELNELKAES